MLVLEDYAAAIDRSIGYFMVDQRITAGQMAALMGMSENALRWKRAGKNDWKWSEILKLADITGKTPNQLAGFAD